MNCVNARVSQYMQSVNAVSTCSQYMQSDNARVSCTKLVMLRKDAGNGPPSEFSERSSFCNVSISPKFGGSAPDKLKLYSSRPYRTDCVPFHVQDTPVQYPEHGSDKAFPTNNYVIQTFISSCNQSVSSCSQSVSQ